jgi:hypothetical protein
VIIGSNFNGITFFMGRSFHMNSMFTVGNYNFRSGGSQGSGFFTVKKNTYPPGIDTGYTGTKYDRNAGFTLAGLLLGKDPGKGGQKN